MNRFEAKWLNDIYTGNDKVENTHVLVACSGGGDSVALLIFLCAISKNLNIKISVAHINHGLRKAALLEAILVRNLCRCLNVDFIETQLDIKHHSKMMRIGIETAARELRWNWLKTVAKSKQISIIATGHTLNDHTETVMIRLARGGGSGCIIPLSRRQNMRWSPLIQVRREDLRSYLKQKSIKWLDDASNLKSFTPRNRWRKMLKSIYIEAPALDSHLWETHLQVEELIQFKDYHVSSWRHQRWEVIEDSSPMLLLGNIWNEVELRWSLEAAFKICLWPREACLLRNITKWAIRHINKSPKKTKEWGGWILQSTNNVLNLENKAKLLDVTATLPWVLSKKTAQ